MKKIIVNLFFLSVSTLIALPPPVPSSGVIERQIEKEFEVEPLDLEKDVPEIQIDIPREKLDLPEGTKIVICKVQIEGNKAISSKELAPLLEKEVGRKCSMVDIYELCHKIEAYYAKKGFFLSRAYPPPQEIKNGVLTIRVLEGDLGHIRLKGNTFYSSKFIMRYFSDLLSKPLNYDRFLRALILLNENSDLNARAIFEKGKKVGEADVIIVVEDKNPMHLYLNANDYGRWLTTDFRAGARFDKGSLFTYGDKLSIAEVLGFPVKALYFTNVVYTLPCNAKGGFLELAYLTSRSHVQQLRELRLRGSSDIASVKFTQAVKRTRFLSCDVFTNFDYKQIKNFTLSQATSVDRLRVLSVGAIIDHNSPGKSRDYVTARAGAGLPGLLNGLDSPTEKSSRPGAQGNFIKFNVDYDHLQKLPLDTFLTFHGSAQWSPNKLTVPEQIYIGGADTIRGFPLAVALGDSGYYCNLECRMPPYGLSDVRFFRTKKKWKDVLQIRAFMDQGGASLKSMNDTFLWGSGLGCNINGPWSLSLSIDVGFPLNHRQRSKNAFLYVKITGKPF